MRGLSSENNDSSDDSLGSFNPNLEKWNKDQDYNPAEQLMNYNEDSESDYASQDGADSYFNNDK